MYFKSIRMFILMSLLLGILIGIQLKSPHQISVDGSFYTREIISAINKERTDIYQMNRRRRELQRELESLKSRASSSNEALASYKKRLDRVKMDLGYVDVQGEGIIMSISTNDDRNLAFLMEERKLLLILINELRINQSEAISLNNQRITPISEVTLAGNHINVNSVPIAPPYEFKAIGNKRILLDNMTNKSPIIDIMKRGYGLNVVINSSDDIIIEKADRFQFIEYIASN